ncbi:MAG: CDP-alcohol phosphatidyltransferase family protein [Bacteroidaceae bacterium]|nr:CDP-alcohol phosphatidyltransferase family protein [Bacteroidaceae bacterium]
MVKNIKQKSLNDTLKSMDTEEFIDIHFYRPVGYRWALFFDSFNIHPNVVTIASIFIGIAAAVCFYFPNFWLNVAGVFLLIWANSYDSADGQLARMTGKKTQWGRILDGFAGDIWFFSIYVALCMRMFPVWGLWIWALGAVSGLIFHSRQSSLADYYRNVHLFFLKGKSGSELDNSDQQYAIYLSLPWKHNFWWKIFLYSYSRYTRSQENMSPSFQKFIHLLHHKYGEAIPKKLRDAFCEKSRPLMKYTNILSFNTRSIALFISVLIDMPWLYFVFELTILNVLLFYMRYSHETISRTFYQQLMQQTDEK